MRVFVSVVASALVLLSSSPALSQDFGVLESAETINRGNLKVGIYPIVVLPDPGDADFRVGVALGGGITSSFDIEGRAAFSDDVTFIGGDGEYWFLKNAPLDLSGRGGLHFGFVEGEIGDTWGVDASVIASAPVSRSVEVLGALDLAFNSMDVGRARDGFTTVHLVPGVEVTLSPRVDLLGEFGFGVTDSSHHYVAFGLAFYLR